MIDQAATQQDLGASARQDELNDCLRSAITVAELLVDGSHESDPIAPYTVQNAGDMIADTLRRARDLIEEGRGDVVASLVKELG